MDIYMYTVQPVYEGNQSILILQNAVYVNRPYKNKCLFHIINIILANMIYMYMYIHIKVKFHS